MLWSAVPSNDGSPCHRRWGWGTGHFEQILRQRANQGVTEIVEVSNRGHALTIDSGWRDVANMALTFIKRFVRPTPAKGMS